MTEEVAIIRATEQDKQAGRSAVVTELPLTVFLNGKELVTVLCSPVDLEYLVMGILESEGIICSRGDIVELVVDAEAGVARVVTREEKRAPGQPLFKPLVASGGGKGASGYAVPEAGGQELIDSRVTITASQVSALIKDFLQRSPDYQATHGVHSAALCRGGDIVVFHDDIGRHNALDKVFGECLARGILTQDAAVITSGRISSEILLKVAKRKVPILISKAPPTNLGVRLATSLGVTVISAAGEQGLNIYSHDWRLSWPEDCKQC